MSGFIIENGTLKAYTGPGGAVSIPDGVERIGERAFAWCAELTSITVPASVAHIGMMAFHACHNLTSVTICGAATQIGAGAFDECGKLPPWFPEWLIDLTIHAPAGSCAETYAKENSICFVAM